MRNAKQRLKAHRRTLRRGVISAWLWLSCQHVICILRYGPCTLAVLALPGVVERAAVRREQFLQRDPSRTAPLHHRQNSILRPRTSRRRLASRQLSHVLEFPRLLCALGTQPRLAASLRGGWFATPEFNVAFFRAPSPSQWRRARSATAPRQMPRRRAPIQFWRNRLSPMPMTRMKV